jgi:hypothetical protein
MIEGVLVKRGCHRQFRHGRVLELGRVCLALLLTGALQSCAAHSGGNATAVASTPEESRSVSVAMLSRGSGVPEATRTVYQSARGRLEQARLDGQVERMLEVVIGLEGERRTCAVFKDEQLARRTYDSLSELAANVDLLTVERRSCAKP